MRLCQTKKGLSFAETLLYLFAETEGFVTFSLSLIYLELQSVCFLVTPNPPTHILNQFNVNRMRVNLQIFKFKTLIQC